MANTMKALQTVTVGAGGAASVTFSSIPQTYTDLVIKMSGRTAYAGIYDIMNVQINGSTTVLATRQIYGIGTAAASDNTTIATNVAWMGYPQANTATANTFGNQEIYIPNYVSSNYKSISYDSVDENNATSSMMYLGAGLWSSANPITSLSFSSANGNNWLQYTTFTLYGVFNQDVNVAPAVPTIGTASDGGTGTTASVAFTGVSGAASYTATSTPGSLAATGTASPITVSGLTTGTAYTFKVKANNPFGSSAESAASNSVTPANPYNFESIATVTGNGSATTLTFSSIPQTYKSLHIRAIAAYDSGGGSANGSWFLQPNAATGNVYTFHHIQGQNATLSAVGYATGTYTNGPYFPCLGNGLTNIFAPSIVDIIDYTSTSKYKTIKSFQGAERNDNSSLVKLTSSVWTDTSAISSITIVQAQGAPFLTGSTFALYGVK